MGFALFAGTFTDGEAIADRFTCDSADISPPLFWTGGPDGTQSSSLIMDDPDTPGGVFTHWVIYDIPPGVSGLPEGVEKNKRPANGAGGVQGRNDFGQTAYGGPCPPPGSRHHYRFQLYALDSLAGLEPGASKQQLLEAMTGHILATATLTGTYER